MEIDIHLPSTIIKCGKTTSICFSKNTNKLLLSFEKNLIGLFELNKGRYSYIKKNHTGKFEKHKCKVISICFDKNSEFFTTACSCGIIIIWNTFNFTKINFLDIKQKIYCMKWHENSDLIVLITLNNQIEILFPDSFCVVRRFYGHDKKITDFLILNKSNFLITASFDKTIKIWDLLKNNCIFTLKFFYSPINLAINKEETILITSHQFTLGLGLIKIIENNIKLDMLKYYKYRIEKNTKLLIIKKEAVNLIEYKVFKNIYNKIFKRKKKVKNVFNFSKKKISSQFKISFFKCIKKTSFEYFNFDLLNFSYLKNLIKIQLKKSTAIDNYNIFIVLFEIYLDYIICDLKINKWLGFLIFFNKRFFHIIDIKNYCQCIFKIISIEANRKNLKYNNIYY